MLHNLRMTKDISPDYKVECGQRLVIARMALGLPDRAAFVRYVFGDEDQAQFKRDQDRVEKWENGAALVPPAFVGRIKRLFGVTQDYIFSNDPSGLPRDLASKIELAQKKIAKAG